MEEMNISTPETEVDDWADIDLSDVKDDGADFSEAEGEDSGAAEQEPEADQPKDTGAEEPTGDEPNTDEQPDTDQYELKHLDEVRTVGREEVIALAQKGMDYDRIRAKLDEREGKEAEAYAFLDTLAKEQGVSVEDFMDSTKASLRAKRDGLDYNAALQSVRMERREAALAERERKLTEAQTKKTEQDEADKRRTQDIADFRAAFPDVDGKSIPKEVWADVSRGMTLLNAYTKYDNARIRAELDAEKQAAENAKKSAGSRSESGKSKRDLLDELWYDGN